MCRLFKTCAILILIIIACSPAIRDAKAVQPSEVTDVRVSDDLRRVVARANGPLNPIHMYRLEGPNRLAILLPDAALGDIDRTVQNPKNRALAVNVSSSSAGVKLVLNFGKAAVPEFKIKVMDNCLIALLGPPGTHPAESQDRSFSSAACAAGSPQPPISEPSRKELRAHDMDSDDLTVCSAEVVNGLVILKVASKQRRGKTYRIKLGLNLDNLGFNSATIAPEREQTRNPRRMTNAKAGSSMAQEEGVPSPAISANASHGDCPVRRMEFRSTNRRVAPKSDHSYPGISRGAPSRGPVSGAYPYAVKLPRTAQY